MLIKRKVLDAIAAGKVDLVFRAWKRPTVRAGGTLRTAIGVLAIEDLKPVQCGSITRREARRAGYDDPALLIRELESRTGDWYRIRVRLVGEDPRRKLRQNTSLSQGEIARITQQLDRWDRASHRGPWTARVLELIDKNPSLRAADLAAKFGQDKPWFKGNVRKLKELGLTESLDVGYRISPRGSAYLKLAARSKNP